MLVYFFVLVNCTNFAPRFGALRFILRSYDFFLLQTNWRKKTYEEH